MKLILSCLLIIVCFSSCDKHIPTEGEAVDKKIITPEKTKQLRHLVLFKFKASATKAQIKEIEDGFTTLPSKIKSIKDFEWGLNNSPENPNKGFTHSFFVSFASEEGRQIYLEHPDHLAFVEILKPQLDDLLVLDYWPREK